MSDDPLAKIQEICEQNPRFRREAYLFTLESLNLLLQEREEEGRRGHVTGQSLLYAMRDRAREQFGFLGAAVWRAWGIRETVDVGDIVWTLVEAQLLSKQESDRKSDFAEVFDIKTAFEAQYLHAAD